MDTEHLKTWKDLIWNAGMFLTTFALLGFGAFFSGQLIREGQPVAESLKIITAAEVIPVFLLMSAYNRISAETIGVILGAIIGFALGKIS